MKATFRAVLLGFLFSAACVGPISAAGTPRPLSRGFSRSTAAEAELLVVVLRGGYSSQADLEFVLHGDGTLAIRRFPRMGDRAEPESRSRVLEPEEVDAILGDLVERGLVGKTVDSLVEEIRQRHPAVKELISGSDCARTRIKIHLIRSGAGSFATEPVDTELELECVGHYPRAYAGIPAPQAAADLVTRLVEESRRAFEP